MTRKEVKETLEKVGPIKVDEGSYVNYGVTDQIWLKICTHPFNDISIITKYSLDGKLIFGYIEDPWKE
jgi:hypothetical protein